MHRAAILANAGALTGCNMAILLANGVKVVTISRLVRAGLASVARERVRSGGDVLEVTRVRITDAGMEALTPLWNGNGQFKRTLRLVWLH